MGQHTPPVSDDARTAQRLAELEQQIRVLQNNTSGFAGQNVPRLVVSGEVVMPKLTPGLNGKLAIGTVGTDTAGWWNAGSTRYIPQKAGMYFVTVMIADTGSATLANKFMEITVAKTGVAQGYATRGMQNASAEAGLQMSHSQQIYCNGTTDYIEAYGNLSDATAGRKSGIVMEIFYVGV